MTTTSARSALAVPLLMISLALAGCGGGSGDEQSPVPGRPNGTFQPQPTGPLGSATASAPASAPGASGGAASGPKVSAASLAQRIDAAAAGAKPASFSIVATGAQPMTASGVTAGTGTSLRLQMNATVSAMSKVKIVKQSGVVYLRPPSPMASGKPWLKITGAKGDPFATFYSTLFKSLETSGDIGATSAVIAQLGTFSTGGTEVVDGVSCTKYTGKPPASAAVKLLPQSFQALEPAVLAKSSTEVSLWIDQTGLPHRIATTLTLPAAQSKTKAQSLVTYQNWGRPITVTLPPAAQIADTGS